MEHSFCLLVGPNGSGKTTTLKILMDLIYPDAGEVTVLGIDPQDEGARVRGLTGYIPERHSIGYPWMKVEYLLEFHAAYYPAWDQDYAQKLIKTLGLRLPPKLRDLSKGEARQVDIITALAHKPSLLLLDEPMEGLDPLVRQTVTKLLADHLSQFPTTVLAATHHVEDLNTLTSHLAVINSGKLVGYGSRDDLFRYLRTYRIQINETWLGESVLGASVVKKVKTDSELLLTIWGEEELILERLQETGASVRGVLPHPLDEAAILLLQRGQEIE